MKRIALYFSLLIIAVLLVSCVKPKIHLTMLEPARNTEAARHKRVYVVPFAGPGGSDVGTAIEAQLVSVEVDKKPYFTVLERKELGRVHKEIEKSQSGLIDQRTAMKVGKLIGAEAIYTGRISQYGIQSAPFTQKRQKCAAYENSNKFFKKCLRMTNYAVACVKKTAVFSFTPKLFEVESGKVVYSRTINREYSGQTCNDGISQAIDESAILASVREEAIAEFVRDVAPNYHSEEAMIMDSPGELGAESRSAFESGVAFAKANRMDRACELWRKAANASAGVKEASLAYNLGLCYEVEGSLELALAQYTSADKMLSRPNNIISQGLTRIQHKIDSREVLDQQI